MSDNFPGRSGPRRPLLRVLSAGARVWIAASFFIVRLREQRELQREIDELNELG